MESLSLFYIFCSSSVWWIHFRGSILKYLTFHCVLFLLWNRDVAKRSTLAAKHLSLITGLQQCIIWVLILSKNSFKEQASVFEIFFIARSFSLSDILKCTLIFCYFANTCMKQSACTPSSARLKQSHRDLAAIPCKIFSSSDMFRASSLNMLECSLNTTSQFHASISSLAYVRKKRTVLNPFIL